jgi:hypothetical protein
MKLVSIMVLAAILLVAAFPVSAQPVISAKSGTIANVLGKVYLGDQLIEPSLTNFPDVKENAVLRTADGRVEVLLPPGVFLRLGENASFRMLSNRLIDTRVELLGGSAIVEADEIAKDTNVTVVARGATVTFTRSGLYRFDMEPARLKVFKGAANVEIGGQKVVVPSGKMLSLDATAAIEKFDTEDTDTLDTWNQRRSQYVAMANISAAKYAQDYSDTLSAGSWFWNPYYGMYTFLPLAGRSYSPYGYCFWSPVTVGRVYYNPPVSHGGGGGFGPAYPTVRSTSSGYSGTMASAPAMGSRMSPGAAAARSGSTAASSAGAASAGHGSGAGGGHGR